MIPFFGLAAVEYIIILFPIAPLPLIPPEMAKNGHINASPELESSSY
jgi:hypothetical protein